MTPSLDRCCCGLGARFGEALIGVARPTAAPELVLLPGDLLAGFTAALR